MAERYDRQTIHRTVAHYYEGKLTVFGANARGVDWKDHTSQKLRHRQFLRLLQDDRSASISDLGCGYGDFLPFLREHGYHGPYIGYDISHAMIGAARDLHGATSDCQWVVGATLLQKTDYVIASGIFNVRLTTVENEWRDYVNDTICSISDGAIKGFAFNCLTGFSDSDKKRSTLYYPYPGQMLDRCIARFGRNVALLHDYGLFEFTVIVHKDSNWSGRAEKDRFSQPELDDKAI